MDNRCVCCGEIIPEGRQVCPNCEAFYEKQGIRFVDSYDNENNCNAKLKITVVRSEQG